MEIERSGAGGRANGLISNVDWYNSSSVDHTGPLMLPCVADTLSPLNCEAQRPQMGLGSDWIICPYLDHFWHINNAKLHISIFRQIFA